MLDLLKYQGVVLIEEIDKETGEVKQSKCFNNITPHGLQVINNGGLWGMAINSLNVYMNEGATYVKSNMIDSVKGNSFWFAFKPSMFTLVGYNLDAEPTDKRFPPHLQGDLTVNMDKVHWYGSGNPFANKGTKEAKLVAPRIKSDDGIRRIVTYEVSAVGVTNAIGIMMGDISKPYVGGQSATVITPVLQTGTQLKQMDAYIMPGVQGLTESNEILFGTKNDGAIGVKNLDDGSYYWLEDSDERKGKEISSGHSCHCVLDGKLYYHLRGQILCMDLSTLTVTNRVSVPNRNYNTHISTDGEFIYAWSDGGYCYKYNTNLVHISSTYCEYDSIVSPEGFGKVTSICYQHGNYYVYYSDVNMLVVCTDVKNVKGSIVGYYATNCMQHIKEYSCFLGLNTLADFDKICQNYDDYTVCETGGIKKVPDTGGSQFNFIWDVKCNDGTPFVVQSEDNPVYVSYGFRGSNTN